MLARFHLPLIKERLDNVLLLDVLFDFKLTRGHVVAFPALGKGARPPCLDVTFRVPTGTVVAGFPGLAFLSEFDYFDLQEVFGHRHVSVDAVVVAAPLLRVRAVIGSESENFQTYDLELGLTGLNNLNFPR